MELINWILFGVFMVIAAWKVFQHFQRGVDKTGRKDR